MHGENIENDVWTENILSVLCFQTYPDWCGRVLKLHVDHVAHHVSRGKKNKVNFTITSEFGDYASVNSSSAHPPPGQPRGIS